MHLLNEKSDSEIACVNVLLNLKYIFCIFAGQNRLCKPTLSENAHWDPLQKDKTSVRFFISEIVCVNPP